MAKQRIWIRSGGSIKTIIESWESLTWTRRYRSLGTLELQVNRNIDGAEFLVDSIGDEISITDNPEAVEPDLTFVVESLTLSGGSDGAVNDRIQVVATEAGLFNFRIALPPPHDLPLSGTESHHEILAADAESAMREIVDVNVGPSAVVERQFPNLVLALNQNRGVVRDWRSRFELLRDQLTRWSEVSNLGWEVQFDSSTNEHVFTVLEGADNSANVEFSITLDNIQTQEWVQFGQDRASFAYVAGQGDLTARDVAETFVGATEPSGAERREIFVDARDLAAAADLPDRGDEVLAERRVDDNFSVEISPISPFRYKRDWDLGDIVTLRSRTWGITRQLRIVEIQQRINPGDGTTRRMLTFGKPLRNLKDRIQDLIGDQATTRR